MFFTRNSALGTRNFSASAAALSRVSAVQWRNSRISRSGSILTHSRRTSANSVALLVPTAAQTATKFSTRWLSSCHPPHILAHLGGSFARFSPTPPLTC
jgi:hypothetical protein